MINAKLNIRNNPEMEAVEKRAQTLWRFFDKTTEEWKEYKECLEKLGHYWAMEERKRAGKK